MFDMPSNHKICKVRAHADQVIGANVANPGANGINMAEASENGLYSRTGRGLLIVEITNVNSTGTLTLKFQDKALRDADFADYYSFDALSAAGMYYFAVKEFKQYVKVLSTVASATVAWGAQLIGFDALRRPVKQTDATAMVGTLATGR